MAAATTDVLRPAIGLLEFDSVAAGITAGDAMVKAAPVAAIHGGTVQPGHYLVLVGGSTAPVEVAVETGIAAGRPHLIDRVLLPDVHPSVLAALIGERPDPSGEALGIIETRGVAAAIEAADAAVKGAAVVLQTLALGDGLGGRGYALVTGPVGEVEAAVEIGAGRIPSSRLVATSIISQLHPEMAEGLWSDLRFHDRLRRIGV